MSLNDFGDMEEGVGMGSSGILYINIYPVTNYPGKIKVSKEKYNKSYKPGK